MTTSTVSAVNYDVDRQSLENQVKDMYSKVALNPHGEFHFEMGRALTERLGYAASDLDRIPSEAIDSFAGVGYYFDLAALQEGEAVLDLGSGSGTDAFFAALKIGRTGQVFGVDMTDHQLAKSQSLGSRNGFDNVEFLKSYIERAPIVGNSIDAVISNGVVNLAADKSAVFAEVHRVLKVGGRLALADIVTRTRLPEGVTCNADLWAACIGGAMQEDDYVAAIEEAGLKVVKVRDNDAYRFISDNAQSATKKWGVKSISLLAVKPA